MALAIVILDLEGEGKCGRRDPVSCIITTCWASWLRFRDPQEFNSNTRTPWRSRLPEWSGNTARNQSSLSLCPPQPL